jgi:dephospho-CoA kinase
MSRPVIGITGILGSGKSAAAEVFAELGAYIIDMDEAGRWAVEQKADVKKNLAEKFGRDIFDSQNNLQRRKLGTIVFSDPEALKILNAIVHPAMLQRVRELVAKAQIIGTFPYIIVDAALIFELGFDQECDATIVVISPIELCLQRAVAYKNLSRDQALERIESQISQEQKAARADIVIVNDASLQELAAKVQGVHQSLVARFDL